MSSSQAAQDPGSQRDPSAHDADHQPAAPDAGTVHRAVAASAIGNATEWFDYGVYAVSVGYITHNFFPGEYGTVLAPILLIVLRAVQGFSTGGEYGGAATFMAEYAPDRKRGFLGSFLEFGTMGGFALGSLIVLLGETFLGHDGMMEWGWRIPFLIAGPMGLIGMYLRSKLGETPVFEEAEELDATQDSALGGLKDLLTGYWRPILTMAGLVIAVNVVNYTLLSYMPTYLEGTGGMEYQTVLTISFVTQFGMMLLIPFAGSLSDRLGRKPVWRISLVGLIVMSVPMYMLMSQGVWGTLIGISVLGLLYVLQLATISATFPAMFPTKVRFAGFAITYNVSTSLFGGTAPSVNEALIEATGSPLVPAFYMVAACIVGLIAVHFMKETVGASLRGNDIPETGSQEIVRIRAGKA